jgi:hypothetical protein
MPTRREFLRNKQSQIVSLGELLNGFQVGLDEAIAVDLKDILSVLAFDEFATTKPGLAFVEVVKLLQNAFVFHVFRKPVR